MMVRVCILVAVIAVLLPALVKEADGEPVRQDQEPAITVIHEQVEGDYIYALTQDYFSFEELEDLDERLSENPDEPFRVMGESYDRLKVLFPDFEFALVKDGLYDIQNSRLCSRAGQYFQCGDRFVSNRKFRVALMGLRPSEEPDVQMPFCWKRCYDARADVQTPFTWNSAQGAVTKHVKLKKGLTGTGYIRPYGSGCFVDGKLKVCVSSGRMRVSIVYPSGTEYSVSAPIQMRYWNYYSFTINPNIIALFVRQHGSNKAVFKYTDLDYKPIDNDEIGFFYEFNVHLSPLSHDPYEWIDLRVEPNGAKRPFCSERIAMCRYNYAGAHAWEENGRIYFSGFYGKATNALQVAVADYWRLGKGYEAKYNTGDLFENVEGDDQRGGVYRVWSQSGSGTSTGVQVWVNRRDFTGGNDYDQHHVEMTINVSGVSGETGNIYFTLIQPTAEGGTQTYYLVYDEKGSCNPICINKGRWVSSETPFLANVTFGSDPRSLAGDGTWYIYGPGPDGNPSTQDVLLNDGWVPPSSSPGADCTVLPDGDYVYTVTYTTLDGRVLGGDSGIIHLHRGCSQGGDGGTSGGGGGNGSGTGPIRFGITQTKVENDIQEEYAFEFDRTTLTPHLKGIRRTQEDLPESSGGKRFYLGYESNRHQTFIPKSVNTAFYTDTGRSVDVSLLGGEDSVLTDDGVFKETSTLCPPGQVELYPEYQGTCFTFVERANCWTSDETRFGNQCYVHANPEHPTVCPSGYGYSGILTPPPVDSRHNYMCYYKHDPVRDPYCPSGEQACNGSCYEVRAPSCPHGYTRNGNSCTRTVTLNVRCPYGYTYNASLDRCVRYAGKPGCSSGVKCDGDCWRVISQDSDGNCPDGWYKVDYHHCSDTGRTYTHVCSRYLGHAACRFGTVEINGSCYYTATPYCPTGYGSCVRRGSSCTCTQTTVACPGGYSYGCLCGRCDLCYRYRQRACRPGYVYNGSTRYCERLTTAQCRVGSRRNDPSTGIAYCYVLDTRHGQPPGHIWCRNGLTYWNCGEREGCYRKEGKACSGSGVTGKVILGAGNGFCEWTGTCWDKVQDTCSSGEVPLRAPHERDAYHCMKLSLKAEPVQTTPSDFARKLCEFASGNVGGGGCSIAWSSRHDVFAVANVSPDFTCPIDSHSHCTSVAGDISMCGAAKVCVGCADFDKVEENPTYTAVKEVREANGKAYGLSWGTYGLESARELASSLGGRLPTSNEKEGVANLFALSERDFWTEEASAEEGERRHLVVVWDDPSDAGFLAECVLDDNGDGLCTADMIECREGVCPYGSQYPCQPYNGKLYCSRFSSTCRSAAESQNVSQQIEDHEGDFDAHDDGPVDDHGNCMGTIYIFNGRDMRCRLAGLQTGFSNCCVKRTTWFGLGQCNEKEQLLSRLRSMGKLDGQCHKIGSYCSWKFLNVCLQRKQTFCCFNSIIGRIIQEQGRPQLGKGWGSPKHPKCKGFTPDEFQKLDFSKMDFSEFFDYIKAKSVQEVQGQALQQATHKVQEFYNNH